MRGGRLPFLHVFPYSERPGTPAARMPAVPKPVRRERAARLRAAGAACGATVSSPRRSGATVAVLTETDNGRPHSEHFAPVRLHRCGDRRGRLIDGARAIVGRRLPRTRAARGARLMALGGFFSRLKAGPVAQHAEAHRAASPPSSRKRRLDDAALEELEELLISADLGTDVAARVIAAFRRTRFGKEVTDEEIKQALAEEIAAILRPGRAAARARSGAETACRAGGRRQRHRQDDHDRQAGAAISRAGQAPRAGRRRYVPRRRGRAVADLGRSAPARR